MARKFPRLDSVGAYQREALAVRRVGVGARCACGEDRAEALIAGTNPTTCAACQRAEKGHTTIDQHHFAGQEATIQRRYPFLLMTIVQS